MQRKKEIEYVSASQIKLFLGCEEKWRYTYLDGIRGPTTPSLELGKDVHARIERYLLRDTIREDEFSAKIETIFQKALPSFSYAPVPEGLRVEFALFDFPERPKGLPVPMKGFIDVLHIKEGQNPEVHDHKTTTNFKYAHTPETLATDTQMVIYAAYVFANTTAEEVLLVHNYLLTKPPYGGRRVEVTVTRGQIDAHFADIVSVVERMIAVAGGNATATKDTSHCWAWGRKCHAHTPCHFGEETITENDEFTALVRLGTSAQVEELPPVQIEESQVTTKKVLLVDCRPTKGLEGISLHALLKPAIKKVCEDAGVAHPDLIDYGQGWPRVLSHLRWEGGVVHVDTTSQAWRYLGGHLGELADVIIW